MPITPENFPVPAGFPAKPTRAEKIARLIDKCDQQNKTDERCHVDFDGEFRPCAYHLAARIAANKSVASIVRANGDHGDRGTWSPDIARTSGIRDRVRIE